MDYQDIKHRGYEIPLRLVKFLKSIMLPPYRCLTAITPIPPQSCHQFVLIIKKSLLKVGHELIHTQPN